MNVEIEPREPRLLSTNEKSQSKAWLIHDTRTPGFLTAAVLARRLAAKFSCHSVAGSADRTGTLGIITEGPAEFWQQGFKKLVKHINPGDQVYLCSITLY